MKPYIFIVTALILFQFCQNKDNSVGRENQSIFVDSTVNQKAFDSSIIKQKAIIDTSQIKGYIGELERMLGSEINLNIDTIFTKNYSLYVCNMNSKYNKTVLDFNIFNFNSLRDCQYYFDSLYTRHSIRWDGIDKKAKFIYFKDSTLISQSIPSCMSHRYFDLKKAFDKKFHYQSQCTDSIIGFSNYENQIYLVEDNPMFNHIYTIEKHNYTFDFEDTSLFNSYVNSRVNMKDTISLSETHLIISSQKNELKGLFKTHYPSVNLYLKEYYHRFKKNNAIFFLSDFSINEYKLNNTEEIVLLYKDSENLWLLISGHFLKLKYIGNTSLH